MSELYSLPDGWEWKELQFFGKFIRGVSYKKEQLLESPTNDSFTLLRANNIQNELELDDIQIVPKDVAKGKEIKDGDILFAMSSGSKHLVGKNILLNGLKNYTFGAFCSIYRNQKNDVLNNYYLSYVLKSNLYRDKLSGLSMGANINNLKSSDLEIMKIPLPPLEEQKRIVAKLDNLFAKIDKAIALHQKNIDEADIFMASVLNEVFVELEEKYEKKQLNEIIKIIGGGTPSKANKEYWENGTIKWATVGDMNVETITKTELSITEIGLKNSSSNIIPKNGIIIVTRVGLGKVCYLEDDIAINQDLKGLIPKYNNLNIRYLFNFFKNIEKYIISNGTGATVKGVKVEFIKELEIPLPPLKTEQKVVSYLDEISQKMEKIKNLQKEKMQSLKELKASILDKAFKGEL
ncbi:restriction endonuclease subunit S [Aliarcobacter cryaerophilus]|uniref:restriction endonuclease subunit S n=1 Tax=Aliarcobacter cryaerophilus TaxID=28198 RepID=UPI0011DF1D44|nr:restriction endonuclease subunit S [Aliarcobacter cryaerophilus]